MSRVVSPISRVLSPILAILLVVAGALLVIEIVGAWLGAGEVLLPVADELRSYDWTDRDVAIVAAVACAVGALSLIVSLWPRPPAAIAVTSNSSAVIDRRSLERSLARRIESIDGVASAKVRVGRKRATVRVDTNRRQAADLKKTAVEFVDEAVAAHDVRRSVNVRVRSRTGEL